MLRRYEAPSSATSSSDELSDDYSASASSSDSSSSHRSKRRRLTSSGPRSNAAASSGLVLGQLTAMSGDTHDNESVYAQQALDVERVKNVLKTKCCKARCKRNLPLKLVMKMITLFWALPKVSQDCVLWSMQQAGKFDYKNGNEDEDSGSESEESEKRQHKIKWAIEGMLACQKQTFL